ncbi:glycosyltransferase family 20-domain-containing protein [Fimicolochytrium jonesii]|uniref:glycosyltransferase family 20-domain-containing protein n=1 Tax=Fimicolochytrium jonesii TaxID=1396493 RepID=UPI0022FF11C6|nr:glycosyltransferase family 20-domain-containing protein [Fimicolochytrium jonesii]KAI8817533.1 glycosyltransferase family 20-domain-containing protein [Fimicolochytrium jonesii]
MTQELQDSLTKELWEGMKCVPVLIDEKKAAGHYEGYCKTDLWPLMHYVLWDAALDSNRQDTKLWEDYKSVNEDFAKTIVKVYQPGDVIWIHDYHLLLLPSLLRAAIPEACIGFFLHTPFPSSELFRCLPKRKEILKGVLGSTMIGFQTYSYARHFLSSCTRVLGLESTPIGVDYNGSSVAIHIIPIGIDPTELERRRKLPNVLEKMASIKEMYAGKKIIIGRDKLDHVKGVQHKMNAFQSFLTMFPEWQNKVVLIQVTSPPERDSPKLEAKVSELVSRINGSFGTLEFAPVHHYHQHLEQDDYYALLSIADLGLITAVRDGMNTTSHEFVVCQREKKGPLILSEFTGTAGSLSAAILVNPWDYQGVANTINEALTLSKEEKAIKHQQMLDHVLSNTAAFWAATFVKELRMASQLPSMTSTTPVLDIPLVVERYRKAKRRLLMFDYDGTLTPIVKTPGAALPPPEMLKAMQVLANDPKNVVFIISGRDQECLENWMGGVKGLGLSAEHGCFLKYPSSDGKAEDWINLSEELDFGWKKEVSEIFDYYTERTQGSFVEHKRCSITWHYRMADPEYGLFQANECQNHLENAVLSKLPIEILIGKKNLEVRPIAINKGEIVKRLIQQTPGIDFLFCAGDDRTDEDMFKQVRKTELPDEVQHNCTIGSATKKTHAQWHVPSPAELNGLLAELAKVTN